jgi:EAL domain-containing protein (putative c-di-GMP-specific phosphodiesterase class I)
MTAISQPITVGSSTISLEASIGISMFSADGPEPDELVRKADLAMYRAKESGQAFHVYSAALHAELLARSTLKRDLEAAIARDEFVVFYQPIISLTSLAIIGAEALVRWRHPTRGLLAPNTFIAFAEEHGLIAAIGETVMRKACAQMARLALAPEDEFTMAVNVSAVQFRRPRFVDSVVAVLAEHGLERSRLEIEITESVIMDDLQSVMRTLHELAALGVKLSIDDFGTGYSSLAYVKTFPVHTLKIDRSFVKDIGANPTDQAIAATIITLAHNLGMRVIAEGVETEEQLAQLRGLGADDMQGFLISRPLSAADFESFVSAAGLLNIAA